MMTLTFVYSSFLQHSSSVVLRLSERNTYFERTRLFLFQLKESLLFYLLREGCLLTTPFPDSKTVGGEVKTCYQWDEE